MPSLRAISKAAAVTAGRMLLDAGIIGRVAGPLLKPFIRPLFTYSTGSRFLLSSLLTEKAIDGAILSGLRPSKAYAKFALPKGLPGDGQNKSLAVQNDPHEVSDFTGVIASGYGKGTKTLLDNGMVILKTGGRTVPAKWNYHRHDAERAGLHFDLVVEGLTDRQAKQDFEINVPRGEFKGRYAFVHTPKGIVVNRMVDRGVRLDKPDYKLKDEALLHDIEANRGQYIVENKIDGALCNALIGESRVTFRSHRDTPNAQTYYDRLPGIEWLRNRSPLLLWRRIAPAADLEGTLIQGEAVHPDGASRVSGIQNARPDRAQQIQKLRGPVQFYAWDIVKLKGRDVSKLPYGRRREILEDVIEEARMFNRNWNIVEQCPDHVSVRDFYERILSRPLPFGEGVVIKKKDDPRGSQWLKVKREDTFDLELVDIVEGNGKYAGTVGTMVVRGPNGEVGEVGSFLIPDTQRDWIWSNRDMLKGQVVEIQAFEMTERGVPRAGRFVRFHPQKSDAGLLMYAESLTGEPGDEAIRLKYKLINSH